MKERGRKKKHRSTIVFLFLLSLLQDSCFHHGCCAPRRAPVEAVGAGAGSPSRGAWVAAVSWTRRESGVGVERLRGQWFFLHQMTDASCIFPPLSLPRPSFTFFSESLGAKRRRYRLCSWQDKSDGGGGEERQARKEGGKAWKKKKAARGLLLLRPRSFFLDALVFLDVLLLFCLLGPSLAPGLCCFFLATPIYHHGRENKKSKLGGRRTRQRFLKASFFSTLNLFSPPKKQTNKNSLSAAR